MDHLTQEQAYLAMFAFLVDRYGETQSGDIGALLSEIALTSDGKPLDERLAGEWAKAVAAVKAGRVTAKLSDGGFR